VHSPRTGVPCYFPRRLQRCSCASSAILAPNRYNITDPLELPLQGADVGVCVMVAEQSGNDIVSRDVHNGGAAARQNGDNLSAEITTKKAVDQFPLLQMNVEPLSSCSMLQ